MTRRDPLGSRRGAALFIVLTFAALLAELAGVAVQDSLSGARAASAYADAARADEVGRAAGDVLAAHLVSGGDAAKRGGALSVRLGDADLRIDYLSESARVDANAAPVALLGGLLAAAGAEPGEVATVLARVAWFRGGPVPPPAPQPGTATDAQAAVPPGQAAQAPAHLVQVPEDVADAWGLPADLARQVVPVLTTASGAAKVDPTLADRLVVRALVGTDDARVDDYMAKRGQGFADAKAALALLPVAAQAWADVADVAAVRAVARVTVAHRLTRRYEMIVARANGAGHPPVTVSWRRLAT